MRHLIVTIALLLIAPAALAAPQPKELGHFGRWAAFTHKEGKAPVCYIAAPPLKSEGKYKKRDSVFLMITHRPAEKTRNVVSHVAGYEYDEKTAVIAEVDGTQFLMVPNDDTAWTPNQKTDDALTDALVKGKELRILGKSKRGTETLDTYELKNLTKALETIDKACDVKVK